MSLFVILTAGSSCLNYGMISTLLVCEKVEEKGTTTYNEVADELVKDFMTRRSDDSEDESTPGAKKGKSGGYDEKNIRRRVYDALNVLMAMDIIYKEKKEIRWNGLPTNVHNDAEMLQREKVHRMKEIQRKRECLREMLVQQVCYSSLVRRNNERDEERERHSTSGAEKAPASQEENIPVPFIVVNTSHSTVIQCEMDPDRTDVFFNFSKPFEINDDKEILKRMGMNKTSLEELRTMLPRDMVAYCQDHRLLDGIIVSSDRTAPYAPAVAHPYSYQHPGISPVPPPYHGPLSLPPPRAGAY